MFKPSSGLGPSITLGMMGKRAGADGEGHLVVTIWRKVQLCAYLFIVLNFSNKRPYCMYRIK